MPGNPRRFTGNQLGCGFRRLEKLSFHVVSRANGGIVVAGNCRDDLRSCASKQEYFVTCAKMHMNRNRSVEKRMRAI